MRLCADAAGLPNNLVPAAEGTITLQCQSLQSPRKAKSSAVSLQTIQYSLYLPKGKTILQTFSITTTLFYKCSDFYMPSFMVSLLRSMQTCSKHRFWLMVILYCSPYYLRYSFHHTSHHSVYPSLAQRLEGFRLGMGRFRFKSLVGHAVCRALWASYTHST